MNKRIEFSDETNTIHGNILILKSQLKQLHLENKLYKELVFFNGDIHSNAQKLLNSNKTKIKRIESEYFVLKKQFHLSYQSDYLLFIERKKKYVRADQEYAKQIIVKQIIVKGKILEKNYIENKLNSIVSRANRDDIYLSDELCSAINKRIETCL